MTMEKKKARIRVEPNSSPGECTTEFRLLRESRENRSCVPIASHGFRRNYPCCSSKPAQCICQYRVPGHFSARESTGERIVGVHCSGTDRNTGVKILGQGTCRTVVLAQSESAFGFGLTHQSVLGGIGVGSIAKHGEHCADVICLIVE